MKTLKYYILGVIITAIIAAGATYAFLSSSTNSSSNSLRTNSSSLNVIMTGSPDFNGELNVTDADGTTGAISTTVKLKKDSNSPKDVHANVYIYMEDIPTQFRSQGFKYRVVATHNSTITYTNEGNFTECRTYSDNNKTLNTTYTDNKVCTNGDKLYIAKDNLLYTDDIEFTVYLWLDGNYIGNEIMGKNFKGYINADTEYFTSGLQ